MLFFSGKLPFLRFLVLAAFSFSVVLLFGGCDEQNTGEILSQIESSNETRHLFSPDESKIVRNLSPLPDAPPPNPTNRFADDPDAARTRTKVFL